MQGSWPEQPEQQSIQETSNSQFWACATGGRSQGREGLHIPSILGTYILAGGNLKLLLCDLDLDKQLKMNMELVQVLVLF